MKILNRIPIVKVYSNRHEPESLRMLADMYWKSLVVCAALLTIVFVAYDLWQFRSLSMILSSARQVNDGKSPLDVMPFKMEDVRVVSDGYAKRRDAHQMYLAQAPEIPDPSK